MTAPAQPRTRPHTDDQAPVRWVAPPHQPAMPRLAPPAVAPRPLRLPAPPSAAAVRCLPAVSPHRRVLHVAVAVAVTLAVVGALSWLGQTADAGVPAETAVVRVGAGETVWDVAQRVAPRSDPRVVVQRIRELNDMTGSAVQPGQQLQVPDGR